MGNMNRENFHEFGQTDEVDEISGVVLMMILMMDESSWIMMNSGELRVAGRISETS